MKCDELADWIHPFVDGELDLARGQAIEQHLEACAACRAAVDKIQNLKRALAEPPHYYRAPETLHDRVRASLRSNSRKRAEKHDIPWRSLAIAASFVCVAVLSWGTFQRSRSPSADERIAQQIVASHVRSLMLPGRDVDVASSDQHTVKPWFNGRLTFAPPVKKLDDANFELIGGRLDFLDRQKVAALVYKRRAHVINLFVWPTADPFASPPRTLKMDGYSIVHWSDGDLTFWAVSDLNEGELREFVDLIGK